MSRLNHPILRSLTGLVLLFGPLMMPHTPGDMPALAVPVLALVILLPLTLSSGWLNGGLRLITTLGVAALGVFKAADLAIAAAYARSFNPVTDLGLAIAAWHLAAGTFGGLVAGLGMLGLGLALLGLSIALFWGLGGFTRLSGSARRTIAGLCGLGLLVFAVGQIGGPAYGVRPIAIDYVTTRVMRVHDTYRQLAAFDRDLRRDPLLGTDVAPTFSALAGRDVVLIFVESYGRSAIEDARYADRIDPRLAAIEHQLERAGRHAVSGWLRSPTMGGMSWLAHGTLLSGLWTDNQRRYDTLIDSDRVSLNRLFKHAGWTTIAAMPAITMAWPEAAWFGYDRIYAADELGYAGKPFNWVTMPDQFTLAAIHRIVADLDTPAMVETALISSHAPWTPIPQRVPWETIGDGRIFNAQAEAGATPAEVWADPAQIRTQYEKAIDYSLATIGDYMARFGDDTVFIVLGDHQPAPIITGERASRDVPMHIVADDPAVLERLDRRYWSPGMIPAPTLPVRPMSDFRADFSTAMSTPAR
ncbi:sulfatase-like hydrolase/transferase [Salinisphaera sp. SPP-AMP-43]|uniref:sulfatase-like hydrolase/transferase n=1 Tax=Salinisphaera sp. SPP-AMP-43 TaxID=3121288 RepID=UPI003C6E4485